jgi:hypothetical protein
MARHPYDQLPDHTKWSRAVARLEPGAVDPVAGFPFTITRHDKVATAGSCFAQHIARHLRNSGFTFFVPEDGHPLGDGKLRLDYNYGIYSARYGNIYTTRQLLQLFHRAFGRYDPALEPWVMPDGSLIDPLRPAIQPGGFATRREYDLDQAQHLRAVRRMFEELDYFVFTLGLTEGWFDRRSGAMLPLCPGVAGGTYDEAETGFVNLTVGEVVEDLAAVLAELSAVNPAAKVIFTVSPVPLAATALPRHVAVSTSYSKAVLRVACEDICARYGHVAYFPSFEVITSSATGGRYFAADRRTVLEDGVDHVMRLFFTHGTDAAPLPAGEAVRAPEADGSAFLNDMNRLVKVLCEEELLDRGEAVREHAPVAGA